MNILLEDETRQTMTMIDDRSLAGIFRGFGPTIFHEFKFASFVAWLEEPVSDHVPLTRGCAQYSHCLGLF